MKADPVLKVVKKATKLTNAPESLKVLPVKPETNDGVALTVENIWATHLEDTAFEWAFALFAENMRELYNRSESGYSADEKRAELIATTARYLMVSVTDPNGEKKPVAFCHYRFVVDYGIPVIYCYELQVSKDYQGKGIGSTLINLLTKMGEKTGMEKVMATVFEFNDASLKFFREKMGFLVDESSPDDGESDYTIFYKPCVVKTDENQAAKK